MGGLKVFSEFLAVIIFAAAVLLSAAAAVGALEMGKAQPVTCSNSVQDGDETGIDCGGSCALTVGCVGNCTSAYIDDYCDGKDNDKDCLVDENCKPQRQPVAAPKQPSQSSDQPQPTCSDGIQNQGELAVDCAGQCAISAEEVCDGIDNDKDCYVDEGGICEASAAQEQSEDLCTFPKAQIGFENQPTYFAVKSPSCIVEDDFGGLKYKSTLNLTKHLNTRQTVKETLQSTAALYSPEGGEGRCSAIFTAYQDAAAARQAALEAAKSVIPLKKIGGNYAYVGEVNGTLGFGFWVKENYFVSVTTLDYFNNHWWDLDCRGLFSAYLEKTGSDLSAASQTAADEQASTIGKTSSSPVVCIKADSSEAECKEASAAIGAGQVPDEQGMIMSCDLDETGFVVCKKVKASELPQIAPDIETAPGVEVVEVTPQTGEASTSAASAEESQVEKIRRVAKQHNIHLSDYDDEKLLGALQKFGNKHKKELEEKYGNQEPSDDKLAEILKRFSQEEFGSESEAKPQASQQQKESFFTKVKNFFKRLF